MEFIYIFFFYVCLRLRFPNVETNPCLRRPVFTVCRLLCTLVIWPWRSGSMTYCCAQRLWSLIRITCWNWFSSLVGGSRIWSSCLVVPGKDASGPSEGGIHTKWIWSISPTKVWVRLLRNSVFYKTELICVQFLSQPWPRWPDFLIVY